MLGAWSMTSWSPQIDNDDLRRVPVAEPQTVFVPARLLAEHDSLHEDLPTQTSQASRLEAILAPLSAVGQAETRKKSGSFNSPRSARTRPGTRSAGPGDRGRSTPPRPASAAWPHSRRGTTGPGRRCPAGQARPPCPLPLSPRGLPRLSQHLFTAPQDEPAPGTAATGPRTSAVRGRASLVHWDISSQVPIRPASGHFFLA